MSHTHVAWITLFIHDSDAVDGKGNVEIKIMKTGESITIPVDDLMDFAASLVREHRRRELDNQTWRQTLNTPPPTPKE